MSADAPIDTRRPLETRLIEKAWKDPAFRKEVLRDPKDMLESISGRNYPASSRFPFTRRMPIRCTSSVPPAPANVSELSDEELEKIAGGTDLFVVTLTGVSPALLGTAFVGTIAHSSGAW